MRIPLAGWVAPFGDPGINDRSHLPRAFRSVPRPSSPLSAKASTRCPLFALERHTQRQTPRAPTLPPWFLGNVVGRVSAPAKSGAHTTDAANFSPEDTAGSRMHGLTAAHGLPLRSHNSLLHNLPSTTPP